MSSISGLFRDAAENHRIALAHNRKAGHGRRCRSSDFPAEKEIQGEIS